MLAGLWFGPSVIGRLLPPSPVLAAGLRTDMPPPGVEASDAPLGISPAVVASDLYRFRESEDPGQAFTAYDPCRPVHYVVRSNGQPELADALVHGAVARVSAATGLQFVFDGATAEVPSARRPSFQPETYGKRWAPVLIAWTSAEENADLAGETVGLGGSTRWQLGGDPWVFVTGQVELETGPLSGILHRAGGPAQVRAVIMHELAHVVGLDHVDDPNQIMYAQASTVTEFAAGDRAGLARLGQGPCVPGL